MAYKAIVSFTDLQDNNHRYHTGDTFPRAGVTVSQERLEELLTDKNRRHKPMIIEDLPEVKEEVPAKVPKKTTKKGGKKKNAE